VDGLEIRRKVGIGFQQQAVQACQVLALRKAEVERNAALVERLDILNEDRVLANAHCAAMQDVADIINVCCVAKSLDYDPVFRKPHSPLHPRNERLFCALWGFSDH
jgi:hypothetical protein